jgi:hypothetical protein
LWRPQRFAYLTVGLAVPLIPALETWLGSEGWARAAEALLLIKRMGTVEKTLLGGG